MQAHAASVPADATPREKSHARLISTPFLLLRSSTAAGAFAMGLVQTFVFARVLSPDRFSIFIVLGAIGYSLWVSDLGLAKILFVNLRKGHLGGRIDETAAGQATAVIILYVLLAVAGALVCFAIMAARPMFSILDASDFALFFLYIAFNLPWYSLRSIAISVDEFLFYEKLEVARRYTNIATMIAMLVGLPFTAFLIGSNALWIVLLTSAAAKLIGCGALAPRVRDFPRELLQFFRSNGRSIVRSGTSSLSDLFTYTFSYYAVPMIFGLGAPVIILEATTRVFRGAGVIFAAACDLAIPGQTRAYAARDPSRLVRTTLMAVGLCAVPAAFACAILIFAAEPLFKFLLRSAATVPPSVTPILLVLVPAYLVQLVSQTLLQHTGYFREISRIGASVAAGMVIATVATVLAKWDIVGFLAAYAVIYAGGALALAVAMVRGPIWATVTHGSAVPSWRGLFRSARTAPRPPPATPARQDTARRIPQPSQSP
jgi:O-antigen/teichoic acid export membrane protein